jgi:hypothetical protein
MKINGAKVIGQVLPEIEVLAQEKNLRSFTAN